MALARILLAASLFFEKRLKIEDRVEREERLSSGEVMDGGDAEKEGKGLSIILTDLRFVGFGGIEGDMGAFVMGSEEEK